MILLPMRKNSSWTDLSYREGKLPLIVPVDIMKSWIIRTNKEYLAQQSFFNPYPSELLDIDSIIEACGDRDYWKNIN